MSRREQLHRMGVLLQAKAPRQRRQLFLPGAAPKSMEPVRMVILGPPVTKKNSQQMVQNRKTGRWFPVASAQVKKWTKQAVKQLGEQWKQAPLEVPVQVCAIFYRERAVGDLNNYMAALADALQAARVLRDDRWIESWDGSRPAKDAANPRVELVIMPLETAA